MIVGRAINYNRLRNPVAAHRARGAVSDPLRALIDSLFGNGEQGAMFIPRPRVLGQQVLFQDAAGTTPVTADGDPVGLMLDLSGNDNHASQETSAARPIYRTDGALHWLEFDGVDDWLDLGGSAVSLFRNAGYGMMASAHRASRITTQVLFSWGDNDGGGVRIQLLGDDESASIAGRRQDSNSYRSLSLNQIVDEPRVQVNEALWSEGRGRITTNGGAQKEGSFHTPGLTDDSDSALATLGRQGTSGSNSFVYRGVVYGVIATRDNKEAGSKVLAYLANLAGVTL